MLRGCAVGCAIAAVACGAASPPHAERPKPTTEAAPQSTAASVGSYSPEPNWRPTPADVYRFASVAAVCLTEPDTGSRMCLDLEPFERRRCVAVCEEFSKVPLAPGPAPPPAKSPPPASPRPHSR